MLVHMAGYTSAQTVWMRTVKQAEPHVDIPVKTPLILFGI